MAESESIVKGEKFAMSLELGDLAKYGTIGKCLRFGLSNIALNFVLFMTIAPWLLNVMGWKG